MCHDALGAGPQPHAEYSPGRCGRGRVRMCGKEIRVEAPSTRFLGSGMVSVMKTIFWLEEKGLSP